MDRPWYGLVCAVVPGLRWNSAFRRRLPPMWRGGLQCLATIFVITIRIGVSFVIGRPSLGDADTVAQLGAAFLIAYGVETSWVIRETDERSGSYQTWLGLMTGLALCGLGGIIVATVLASGTGTSAAREIGFAWSCVSIFMLGLLVAITPVISYEWRHQLKTEFDDE
jgi:hypothetical protein